MPLHHFNASDAENFDTLGVTGLNLSSSVSSNSKGLRRSNEASRSSISNLSDRDAFEGTHHNQTFPSDASNLSASLNGGSARLSLRGSESSSNDLQGSRHSFTIGDSRHSFTSVGSSSHNYARKTFNSPHEPIYEDVDQSSGLHSECEGQQNFVQEEDETQSLSTMEDSFSVTGRASFQQHSNRFRQGRQKLDADSSSVTSSSVCRSQESIYSSQLESRVTKLSLELATTKALLDELRLENRRVKSEKDEFKLVVSALEGENEQLHRLVEKLEKEKLLMSMEKTVGVAQPGDGLRSSFVNTVEGRKKEDATFEVSTFRAEPRGSIKKKGRRRRSRSGDELEVPFNPNRAEIAKELKRSYQSDADFSVSSAGDGLSVGAMSLHSIADLEHAAKLIAEGACLENSDSDKEEYDNNDPFATWSAPEDRAKQENKQGNWFQRGVTALSNPHRQDVNSEVINGDPFDTCSKSSDSLKASQQQQQDRKGGGFHLFRGLRGNLTQK